MRLRNRADRKTLAWLVLGPALVAAQLANPTLIPYLGWATFYFALSFGIIAHNHNHCRTFHERWANEAMSGWLSIFYGYPTFAWIPTHNLNHHRFVNAPGDATITWRLTNRHNLLVAVTYFFVSAYYQSGPISEFIARARRTNRPLYWRIVSQYAVWIGGNAALAATAIWLHGFGPGLKVYGLTVALPALFALWTIMLFNYDQHVHADPSSQNHSRSFSGSLLNFLLFNNGYHAAHHENSGLHWSQLPLLHEQLAPEIAPELIQRSLWWYWVRQYCLAPFLPSLGTRQLGADPSLGLAPKTCAGQGEVASQDLGGKAPIVLTPPSP